MKTSKVLFISIVSLFLILSIASIASAQSDDCGLLCKILLFFTGKIVVTGTQDYGYGGGYGYGGYCGDGNIDTGEQCDAGANNNVTCSPPYHGNCTYCSSTCTNITLYGTFCGDLIVEGAEQCDSGEGNGWPCTPPYGGSCTYCSSTCTNIVLQGGYCGDGILNNGEQCDDGNNVDGDGCSSTCLIEGACNPPCVIGDVNGDGVLNIQDIISLEDLFVGNPVSYGTNCTWTSVSSQ